MTSYISNCFAPPIVEVNSERCSLTQLQIESASPRSITLESVGMGGDRRFVAWPHPVKLSGQQIF